MANITEHAAATTIGHGILMPKLSHRFRVTFRDSGGGGEAIQNSEYLTMQVMSISGIEEIFGKSDTGGQFVLKIEDDLTNRAMSVVRSLAEKQSKFTTVVSMLDGDDGVVSTEHYYDCTISQILHSDRTYARNTNGYKAVQLSVPNWMGDFVDALVEDPKTKALVSLLNGSNLTLVEATGEQSASVQKTLVIKYNHVSHTLK